MGRRIARASCSNPFSCACDAEAGCIIGALFVSEVVLRGGKRGNLRAMVSLDEATEEEEAGESIEWFAMGISSVMC
jgi:hypothetical protein